LHQFFKSPASKWECTAWGRSRMTDDRARSLTERAIQNAEANRRDGAAITARVLGGVPNAPDQQIARDYLPGVGFSGATRLSIARADTPEEATMRLRQEFPEGQYFPPSVVTENRATYQTAPGEPLSFVAPTIGEAFETGGFLGAAGEILQKTANLFAPSAEAIGAETALLVGSQGRSLPMQSYGAGARLARYMLAGAGGGAIGETARQGVQTQQGIQSQDLGEQAQQVAGTGIGGALGGALGFGLEAGVRRLTSAGPMGVSPRGQEAVRAMGEFADLPGAPRAPAWMGLSTERVGMMPQQVVREGPSEIFKRISGAASRVWPRINNYTQTQRETILNAVERARDPNAFGTARAELTQAVEELNAAFASDLASSLRIRGMNPEELGIAIAAGREVYESVSKEAVDGMYAVARAGGDYRFDTTPVDAAIARIRETALRPLPGADGQPVPMDPEGTRFIRDWIGRWERTDKGALGVDDLRALRGNLYQMSQPGYEGARLPDATARQLRAALGEALENPTAYIGPDGVPTAEIPAEPLRAWRSAQEAARQRFLNLENSTLMEIARSDRPFELARRIVLEPGNADQVIALRRVLNEAGDEGAQAWSQITNGFKSDLVDSIRQGQLPERLAQYEGRNQLALDALLSSSEREAFERTAASIRRLRQTDVPAVAQSQETAQSFAQALFGGRIPSSRPAAIIDSLQELAQRRGLDSWADTAPGQSVRAAAFDTIIDLAIETTPRGPRLNQGKFQRALLDAERRGLMQLLTPADRELLSNVNLVNAVVEQSAADVGTAIAGAAQAQVFSLGDFMGTIPYLTIGRIMTSNTGRNLLIGAGIQTPQPVARTVNAFGRLVDDSILSQEDRADLAGFIGQIDPDMRAAERERLRRALPIQSQGMLERGLQQGRSPRPQ
jgi:hypothetical protein